MESSGAEGQWSPRFRVVLITVMLLVVVAATALSALLVADADEPWTPGSIARAALIAVLALFSGVCVNFLPAAIIRVWRPTSADLSLRKVVGRVAEALRRPLRWLVIAVTVVAIVAVGLALRPPVVGLEEGELVVMTAFDESREDPRTVLIDQWNQVHPRSPARIDFVPGEPDQQNTRMVNDAKEGGDHVADVYVLDLVWLPQFAERGYLRELDRARLTGLDDFVDKVLDTCVHDEELWALPFNTDVGMLHYRTDVPGVVRPKTWEDHFGATATVPAEARSLGVEAVNAAQLADAEILAVTAMEAMWAAGGETFGRNGQVAQNEDKTSVVLGPGDRKGLELLSAAARNPEVVLTGEVRSTTDNIAVDAFGDGRTMFMRNWPVVYERLRDRVEFDVAAPPTPSALGGQNLAIRAGTDRPRAAQALVEFLTSASSQLILSEVGGFAPTRQSAYDNASRRDIQELRTALDNARPRPVDEHYVELSQVFRKGVIGVLNDPDGRMDPAVLQEMSKIVNR